jgi:hypothetical protein
LGTLRGGRGGVGVVSSLSRHRVAAYHEKPSVTLERLARLESVMMSEIGELKQIMKDEG